ncbi:hypothetical protein PO002_04975 [Cupriavidus necator]|uniref:hypothetical protein n=1 Tax=Cupriavidus necator TaxID=106590 RepID=UPI0039C097B6
MTIAIEVSAWRLSTGLVETLRFADAGFTTRPSDTPANAYFEPCLREPPRLSRVLFDGAATYGASRVSVGEILLANADGQLDVLLSDYAFDGRPFSVRVGAVGGAVSSWPVVMSGTLEDVRAAGDEISLVVRDRLAVLGQSLPRAKYAGDNVLPDGLEGTADDLKDQYKPRVYGRVLNVSAKCVNSSKLIYQVSDQGCTVDAVYDNGAALALGAAYASEADLLATAPAAGDARCWGGLCRLGSPPAGEVTVVAETTETRAGALLQAVALDAGVPSADIVSADVSALNAANAAKVGVWVDGDASAQAVMDALANAIGAWYGFDRFNRLRMGRLTAPSGPPTLIHADAILALSMRAAGVPNWRAVVRYARNYTVQTQPAGAAPAARRAFLALDMRQTASERPAVQTAWPSSEEIVFDTALIAEADAAAEASRRADLYSVRRALVDVEIRLDELGAIDLDSVVELETSRYGLSGQLLRVIGLDAGVDRSTAKLTLWG